MKEKKTFYSGAITLAVGIFISKFIGAIYRIPLSSILGGSGLGIYQLVFPVYSLLLDFSGASAPNALSKVISSNAINREEYSKRILKSSIIFFSGLGLLFSLIIFFLSKTISLLQGNADGYLSYIAISPSIFFVCILSCFRGYFQGNKKMFPTAISQIIEQIFKLIFGLALAYYFLPNIKLAVFGAILGITISEVIALIVIFFIYKKSEKTLIKVDKKILFSDIKKIVKIAIPISLIGVVIPLSQVADSFIIVNILSNYIENSTMIYGIYSGAVMTVINLPVSICYSIAMVTIPYISSCRTNKEKENKSMISLYITLVISVLAAIFCYLFSPLIVKILFSSFSDYEKQLAINILKVCSPIIVLLSFLQTSNSILIARNKIYSPLVSMVIGVFIKIILEILLIRNQRINIYGSAIALIVCYFIADLINLIMLRFIKGYDCQKNCTKQLYMYSK